MHICRKSVCMKSWLAAAKSRLQKSARPFLRAVLEEHAEAADGWRELIQWNSGVDESLRIRELWNSDHRVTEV